MKLQGRSLLINMEGEDIGLLHSELRQLDYAISDEEIKKKFFGETTRQAVLDFQKKQGLESTAVVNERTAGIINAMVDASKPKQKTEIQSAPSITKDQIRQTEDKTLSGTVAPASDKDRSQVNALGVEIGAVDPPIDKPLIEGHIFLEYGLPAAAGTKLKVYSRSFGGVFKDVEVETEAQGYYKVLPSNFKDKITNLEVCAVVGNKEISLSKTLHGLGEGETPVVNLFAPTELQPLAAEYQRLTEDLTKKPEGSTKPLYVGEMKNLAEAQENAERQDITILSGATGWDGRLIASASNAAKLSADTGISQEVFYGLIRAGLPSDKLPLAQVSVDTAKLALKNMKEAGIVSPPDQDMADLENKLPNFANKTRLTVRAPGSNSTYGHLLTSAGLVDEDKRLKFASVFFNHRGDGAQLWTKAAQAGINSQDIQTLQRQGKLAFLTCNSKEMTNRLQNVIGISDPVELAGLGFYQPGKWKDDAVALAGELKIELNDLIPPAYEAEGVEDRLSAYAEDMARKVRLSYPTPVVGHMVENDADDRFKLGTARPAAAALLKNAAAKGFRLGQTPVDSFVRDHPDVLNGIDSNAIETANRSVKTLQRVYQITPSNEAMLVLLSHGLTSAYDVVALSQDEFLKRHGHKFPSLEQARLVYQKAEQVSSVTYNLFTIAKTFKSETQVYGISAPIEVRESVKNELIKQFPTMESLFGSMDFCECEHCRSVLSPAAYLVDLLQFIDPEPIEWGNFLAYWQDKHNGQNYTAKYKKAYEALIARRPDLPHIPLTCENTNTALPYIDVVNEILEYYVANDKLDDNAAHDTGDAITAELLAEPQNVVVEAYTKVQLARYPLNLPFDLWIETVRQFCDYFETPLWRMLDAFRQDNELFAPAQSYDCSNIFIESLGLSPTEYALFVDPNLLNQWHDLYGYTKAAIGNPTNTTNATVDIPNADALKFKIGDLCTYLNISANTLHTETKMISAIGVAGSAGQTTITFTGVWNTAPTVGDFLVFDALGELKKAKALSRRLGVTYKELVEIVQTGFVNPKLAELVILHKLRMTIQDMLFYRDHKTFYEQNIDLLVEDRSTLPAADQQRFDALSKDEWKVLSEVQSFEQQLDDLSETFHASGFNAKDWLNKALQTNAFDDILMLADPDAGCNFDLTTLCYGGGKAADAIAFLKINLFVRLWRKLGWTIEETDRALQAFVPKNTPFDAAHLAQSPLKTALIYLAHLKALDGQLRVGMQSRLKLITLWSDLATTGEKPLYAQLFLARSVLKSDAVFDDALGQYLSPVGLAAMAQSWKYDVQLENVAPADKIEPAPFAAQPKVKLFYDALQNVQHLTYEGVLTDADKIQLIALSPSPALPKLLQAVQVKASEFTRIKGHLLTLQGALGLTADEMGQILTDAGSSIEAAELSLANVSLLYRYGLLAKALKLSIRELITLKYLSDLDPFKQLHPDPVATLKDDYPFTQTLRFIEIVGYVKESGLNIEDLTYLLRHHIEDSAGKYCSNSEATLVLIKTLAEGVRAIQAEHAVPDDAGSMSEEVLRQKLGLVLPNDVAERFLAMMNGTVEFTATKIGVQPENQLKPEEFADEPSIRQVSYNATRQEQKLTFRGVLFDAQKNDMKGRLPKPVPPNPFIPSPILGELLDDIQMQAHLFFVKNLQKQPVAGFLDAADFDLLLAPTPTGLNEAQKQERVHQQRTRLIQAFIPFLQQRLIRQFIIQTLTAQTGADPALVESLLTDARLLNEIQPTGTLEPLLAALTATGELGLTATFFSSVDGSGAVLGTSAFSDADTGLKDKDGNPLKPAGANSARFEGYLEVPAPGAYRFILALDKQNAEADLRFDHLSNPLFLSGTAANDGSEVSNSKYLELKPGVPYRFTLALRKLNGGDAQLLVQGETLPKDRLAQLTLYPLRAIERGERAFVVLSKTLQLTQSLNLNEHEVRYLLMHGADFGNLNLSKLPTRESDDSPAGAKALFMQFLRLAGYTRLKGDLAGGMEDLIGVFEANEASDMNKVYSLISRLTRRDEATIKATANALFAAPAFPNELAVQRLWEALKVVERFGVPVASIVGWTRIVSAAATPEQRFTITRNLKNAIKARFEPEIWQRVAQPIFDKLRQRQRDALVAHIMHQLRFGRMDQLYEYFLIDPGMEPVVQTSRIRLAIASVQLFIQRCLLNLEKQVHPSVINARQWEWMKRYRVWEANRKIFLFPENWLEPEFRDDKTHLFNELEGKLLQGDVSSDLVEDAFLNYLKKLEELARLDIVAMHMEDKSEPALNTLHVIGRSYSQPHKYFYRRYAHQEWTPWEPVTAEIEGDHLAPVVWRNRLYLFWVTFLEKPVQSPTSPTGTKKLTDMTISEVVTGLISTVAKKEVEVQLHWSEYLLGEWSTQESGGSFSKTVDNPFNPGSVFIHVSKEDYENGEERGVFIHLGGAIDQAFYMAGRNSLPESKPYEPDPTMPYNKNGLQAFANRYSASGALTVEYKRKITTEDGKSSVDTVETPSILETEKDGGYDGYTLLPCNNNITSLGASDIESLMKPIFYQDNAHTLFIEPTVTERTIEEWQEWVTRIPQPDQGLSGLVPEKILVKPQLPYSVALPPIHNKSRKQFNPDQDWLVNPGTGLLYDVEIIAKKGRAEMVVKPPDKAAKEIAKGGMTVKAHPGSGLPLDGTIVALARDALDRAGLIQSVGGLNVVGRGGFNTSMAQNFDALNRSGFGGRFSRRLG